MIGLPAMRGSGRWRALVQVILLGVPTSAACAGSSRAPATAEGAARAGAGKPGATMPIGLDEAAMDPTVAPCDDFYRFACGRWVDQAEIRKDFPLTDRSFIALTLTTTDRIRTLLENASSDKGPLAATTRILGDFYGSCTNEDAHGESLQVLRAELGRLQSVRDARALAKELALLHLRGGEAFFAFGSAVDPESATSYVGEVDQGGLGLPTRDYYLDNDEKTLKIRAGYRTYIERVSMLLAEPAGDARARADAVIAIETTLAKAALGPVDRRDAKRLKNRLDLAAVRTIAPAFPWTSFFKEAGTPGIVTLNVTNPPTLKALERLLKAAPWPALQAYLGWRLVITDINALSKPARDAKFEFDRLLTGAEEQEERWRECSRMTEALLRDAIGEAYVAKHFVPLAKERATEMARAIATKFRESLTQLAWMDDSTRARALEKLDAVVLRFGYPDVWRAYDGLVLDRTSFLTSYRHVREHETRYEDGKIGKLVDRREWRWAATTINMGNSLARNALTFPAAVLQPPIFDVRAPLPVLFGSAGVFIGHEFTHGFDDQGRQFDVLGGTNEWWTDASSAAFRERAGCLRKQFDKELWIDDVHVKGTLTLGENIADLGGAKLAYSAMMASRQPAMTSSTSRYTDPQQFFLGYAQVWCSKYRPEFSRMLAQSDPHSPPALRVNMPLRNMPEFQQAFACPSVSKMVLPPQERCAVW